MSTLTFSSAAQGYDLKQGAFLTTSSATSFSLENLSTRIVFTGTGLTYDTVGGLHVSGSVTGFKIYEFDNSGSSTPTLIGTAAGVTATLSSYSIDNGLSKILSQLLAGADSITGSSGNDSLNGYAGNDTLNGGAGNDTLIGGIGSGLNGGQRATTLLGGIGNDVYIVNDSQDAITEAADGGTDLMQITWIGGYTLAANVENAEVIGTPGGSVMITGNNSNNLISGSIFNDAIDGGAGNDRLVGLGNNDHLNGGTGNDTMIGGAGADTYYVDSSLDRVIEEYTAYSSREPGDRVISTISYTLGNYVECLKLMPGTSAINGTGNALNNMLIANNGANVLNGGAGIDTASFETATTKVTVSLTASTATGGSGTDTLISIENLYGGSAGDLLTGNASANVLDGKAGIDTLAGGAGNDTYYVDVTGDVVTETSGGGTDTVYSLADYTLGNYVENLNLSPKIIWDFSYAATYSTAINGTGNALANAIIGNFLNNKLLGLGGNDTLSGGAGNDTLTGGTGSDVFRFNTAFSAPNPVGYNYPPLTSGIDTLVDFTSGTDKIHLSDGVFTALGAPGALASGAFVAGTSDVATTTAQRLIYNTSSGALFYDADGSGAQQAAIQIALVGITTHPVLASTDFLVV